MAIERGCCHYDSQRGLRCRHCGEIVKVVVTLCTRRRPMLLETCLEALIAQQLPTAVSMSIVVVENDHSDTCRDLVQTMALRRGAPPLIYHHEPTIGIPFARNRALELALEQNPDWVAITDDDTQPNAGWLANLLAAQMRFDADVVYGRVNYTYPRPLPPFAFPKHEQFYDGQQMERAACNNVMFAAYLIRPEGLCLRFSNHLAHGEDTDFFYRAHNSGARIIHSIHSVVREMVPPERLTLSYQAKRKYYYVASYVDFLRRYRGLRAALRTTLTRLVTHAPAGVVRLAAAPLLLPMSRRRFRKMLLRGTERLTATAGAVAGLLGFRGNPYKYAPAERRTERG
jgi:succinoglycan biosynthesis protein ExoM